MPLEAGFFEHDELRSAEWPACQKRGLRRVDHERPYFRQCFVCVGPKMGEMIASEPVEARAFFFGKSVDHRSERSSRDLYKQQRRACGLNPRIERLFVNRSKNRD